MADLTSFLNTEKPSSLLFCAGDCRDQKIQSGMSKCFSTLIVLFLAFVWLKPTHFIFNPGLKARATGGLLVASLMSASQHPPAPFVNAQPNAARGNSHREPASLAEGRRHHMGHKHLALLIPALT
jgi:hypothetical protein